MQIFEAMTPNVVSAMPETTLMDAALIDEGRLVGVITDRDITVRATAEGRDPRVTRVGEIMSPEVVTCAEGDDVRSAARLMQDAKLRRLLVVDGAGNLAGIVSLADLVLQTGDDLLAGETLEKVSEPAWTLP
jgi:CBS domain-containing protein